MRDDFVDVRNETISKKLTNTPQQFGMNKEYTMSSFVLLFMALLMASIFFSHAFVFKFKLKFLSEAGAIIVVGLLSGAICLLFPSDSLIDSLVGYDPTIFFVILLPPIIFNSGYTMKSRYFFENITSILMFAVVGTLISTITIGLFLHIIGKFGWSLDISIAECLTFGAMISSTDPVSTLAVFQDLRVNPTLFYLVFGESVLNDAVSIVLFSTFSKFVGTQRETYSIPAAVLDFFLICIGSTCVGILIACFSSIVFKYFNFKACLFHEIGMFVLFAYIPFLVAETLQMSGIVAILFNGIFMKHYTVNNLSLLAREACDHFFSVVAFVSETAVFLNLGLSFFAMESGYNVKFILWTLFICLLSRACNVYPLSYIVNKKRKVKISSNQQHMICFSGLRGAIAFSLSLSFPGQYKREIMAATMVVVVVTVIVMGGATEKMLDILNIKRYTQEEEEELEANCSITKRNRALQYDARYLMPFFTNARPVLRVNDTEYTGDYEMQTSRSTSEFDSDRDTAATTIEDSPVSSEIIDDSTIIDNASIHKENID